MAKPKQMSGAGRIALLGAGLLGCRSAPTTAPSDGGLGWHTIDVTHREANVVVERVSYGGTGTQPRVFGQVCRPTGGTAKHPVVALNHGGFSGLKGDADGGLCVTLARKGYVAIEASYRGEDGSQGNVEACHGEVDDVLAMPGRPGAALRRQRARRNARELARWVRDLARPRTRRARARRSGRVRDHRHGARLRLLAEPARERGWSIELGARGTGRAARRVRRRAPERQGARVSGVSRFSLARRPSCRACHRCRSSSCTARPTCWSPSSSRARSPRSSATCAPTTSTPRRRSSPARRRDAARTG